MKTNSVYKYIAAGLMVLVLTCSIFANVVSAEEGSSETAPPPVTPPAQNVAPEEGTNETAPPTAPADPNADTNSFEQTSNINQAANPNAATDALEQSSGNTSANTQSQNNTDPKQAGGSGNQDTVFSLRMLNPYNWIPVAMKIIGNTILMMFGWVLGLVGLVFNFIIDKTIVNLKTTIDSLGVITDIWKVIRDFINLFFIFALLYAAVGTILGLEKVDWKKTVGNLVLAALLINFSLFITKVALDLSNIVTIGFYSQLPGVGAGAINPGSIATGTSGAGGISNSIMQSLKLETIYKPKYGGVVTDIANSPVTTFAYILSTVMGSIFICVTIVVMVAACWLFLKRFIDIIFLMIRSPIAFAGFVLPQLGEYQSNWWKELQANVVFPPVYMAMMWITFKILQSPGFQTVAPGADGFSGLFSTLSGTTVNIVFRFIIVIAMMVYALKSASKVGIEGGEVFTDYLKKKKGQLQGVVGRNTLGRAAAAARDSGFAKNIESVSPLAGRLMNSSLKNVAGADFGGAKGGFDGAVKQSEKNAKEGYGRMSKVVEWNQPKPYRKTFESAEAFAMREAQYESEKKDFEKKEGDAKPKRQQGYVEAIKTGTPVAPALNVATNLKALDPKTWTKENIKNTKVNFQPYRVGESFKENVAAVAAVNKQIKEDTKKDAKKTEEGAAWEKGILAYMQNIGAEIKSSRNSALSPALPEAHDESTEEGRKWKTLQADISAGAADELSKIEAMADKEKKAEQLEKMFKRYKEAREKLAEEEVVTLEEIADDLADPKLSPESRHSLQIQKRRILKSQKTRNELHKKLEKIEESREKREEKESDKKEKEGKEKEGGGGEAKVGDKK
ncbi:MAG: hypothetical protein WCO79_00190 [bacterium]